MNVTRLLLVLATILLYFLHQDFWFWRTARPIVFGLPIGLLYHAGYCLAVCLLMWLLVRFAWPAGLEQDHDQRRDGGTAP